MKVSQMSLLAALALGALVAIVPTSRAQDSKDAPKPATPPSGQRQRSGGGGANQMERLTERLKLTEDQQAKLKPIVTEETGKLRDLRNDTSLSSDQRREKAKELREQYLAKMKPILSTEQFDQLKKMREQARGQGGPRPPRQSGETHPPADADKKQ